MLTHLEEVALCRLYLPSGQKRDPRAALTCVAGSRSESSSAVMTTVVYVKSLAHYCAELPGGSMILGSQLPSDLLLGPPQYAAIYTEVPWWLQPRSHSADRLEERRKQDLFLGRCHVDVVHFTDLNVQNTTTQKSGKGSFYSQMLCA